MAFDSTRFVGGIAGVAGLRIAPGIDALMRDYFRSDLISGSSLEEAIFSIEEELAQVSASIRGAAVASSDSRVRAIAAFAGVPDTEGVLYRDAVEYAFSRLCDLILGRHVRIGQLGLEPLFVPALLVVRETMHHLDVSSILVSPLK